MEFSRTELWLIVVALENELCELRKKIELADEDYKNETGEWGITHEERDSFLYEKTGEILEKIMYVIKGY